VARHVARRALDVGEVGRAVLARRRPDGEEDDERLFDRRLDVRGELQAARLRVLRDYLVKPRLVDGDVAPLEPLDLLRVHVNAGDRRAELGKTGARHKSDVARPDYRYVHLP
jgi:hypothetical protein